MWYNCLNEYLIRDRYTNKFICPCILMKRSIKWFSIIVVYVDVIKFWNSGRDSKNYKSLKEIVWDKDIENAKLCLSL